MSRYSFLKALSIVALALAGPAAAQEAKPYAGQTITVLLPPWGTLPKTMTDRFQAKTGITAEIQSLGWDAIHAKILTSMVAGTAPADVTEVDWSWVGQFAAAGWYQPMDGVVDAAVLQDLPAKAIFTVDGQLIAMPYNNDFRILIVNRDHLQRAGVAAAPKTPDELLAAARAIKQKGIAQFPIGIPLSVSEGTSTAWYLLTKAFGGELFDAEMKPAFADPASPGFKALAFEIGALQEGLIDPAAAGLTDVQVQQSFMDGRTSIDLAGWAGNPAVYQDPAKSKVAGSVETAVMVNVDAKSRSFGLPGALGIPANAEHKEAAVAFVAWWMQPATQIEVYNALGDLPTRTSVLETLNGEGKLTGGDTLLAQVPSVEPLFAQGAPAWYPQFSSSVSSAINQAAKGQITVEAAIAKIAEGAEEAMRP